MKKRRFLSILLAVALAFGCCVPVFADTYPVDLQVNAANHITLNKADKNTGSFSVAGSFVVVVKGIGRPEVQITYGTLLNDSIALDATANADGFICEVCEFPIMVVPRKYDVKITSSDSKKCDFDLWIIDANWSKSGFTRYPNTDKIYYEDLDVTIKGTKVTFINDTPDFSDAVFSFKNDRGTELLQLTGAEVACILNDPVYNILNDSIVYSVKGASLFNSNSSFKYSVKTNPIQSVRIKNRPSTDPVYHFGKDGIIKGTLHSCYFRPDLKFDGITFTVTYKDSAGGGSEDLAVQKDANGYYVDTTEFGRQNITYTAEVVKNRTQDYEANVNVGGASFLMVVKIERANIFEYIGIWFRLLFGKYR